MTGDSSRGGPFLQILIHYDIFLTNAGAEILTSEPLGWKGPSILSLTVCNHIFSPLPLLRLHSMPRSFVIFPDPSLFFEKMAESRAIFHCILWRWPVTLFPRDVKVHSFKDDNRKHQISLSLCIFWPCFREKVALTLSPCLSQNKTATYTHASQVDRTTL